MNIIKKCLDELEKDDFRKDYVIGLLESFYEIESSRVGLPITSQTPVVKEENKNYAGNKTIEVEEIIPNFLKAGPVVDTSDGRKLV